MKTTSYLDKFLEQISGRNIANYYLLHFLAISLSEKFSNPPLSLLKANFWELVVLKSWRIPLVKEMWERCWKNCPEKRLFMTGNEVNFVENPCYKMGCKLKPYENFLVLFAFIWKKRQFYWDQICCEGPHHFQLFSFVFFNFKFLPWKIG